MGLTHNVQKTLRVEQKTGVCPGQGQPLGTDLGNSQRKLLAEVVSWHSRQIIEGILQTPSENSSKDRGVAPTPSPCLPVINNLYNVVLRLDLITHDGTVIN